MTNGIIAKNRGAKVQRLSLSQMHCDNINHPSNECADYHNFDLFNCNATAPLGFCYQHNSVQQLLNFTVDCCVRQSVGALLHLCTSPGKKATGIGLTAILGILRI